jgi:hypothetical protein
VKWRVVREHALRELTRLHGVDALLDCQLFDVRTFPEMQRDGFAIDFVVAGEVLRTPSGWGLRNVKHVHVLGIAIGLRDRGDSLLYRASEPIAWIALRNADNWTLRSSEDVFSPAHDARIDLLLVSLRNSTESAATPPEAP